MGINLIPFLRERYGCPAGLSDHSGKMYPSLAAVTLGAEDLDFFHRVLREGLTICYEPAARVRHRHRRTVAELRHQVFANGCSYSVYLPSEVTRRPGTGGRSFVGTIRYRTASSRSSWAVGRSSSDAL